MAMRNFVLAGAAAVALAACGEGASAPEAAPETATAPETAANTTAEAAGEVQNGAISGVYTPDPNHHYIAFSYFHQGYSRPILRWGKWTGELSFNAEDPAASSVNAVIDATSIDSGVAEFNGHLNGERLFDTAKHPEITFASTSVTKTGPATAEISGDLTIKGVTKPVTLHATFNKGALEERVNVYKIGFSGVARVKRSDFGIDYAVPIVSDEVDITIETEWVMPAQAGE